MTRTVRDEICGCGAVLSAFWTRPRIVGGHSEESHEEYLADSEGSQKSEEKGEGGSKYL